MTMYILMRVSRVYTPYLVYTLSGLTFWFHETAAKVGRNLL